MELHRERYNDCEGVLLIHLAECGTNTSCFVQVKYSMTTGFSTRTLLHLVMGPPEAPRAASAADAWSLWLSAEDDESLLQNFFL